MKTKRIPLTKGKFAIVDADMFEYLNQWKWHVSTEKNYVARNKYTSSKKRVYIFMHREIMHPKKSEMIDHVNRNPLDNRRCNLRICTNAQNMCNVKKYPGKTSKYKGVSWKADKKKWEAYITVGYKKIHLGGHLDEKAAAAAYDRAAKEFFGEFASLNLLVRRGPTR